MSFIKRTSAVVAFLMIAVLVAACGDDDDSVSNEAATANDESTTSEASGSGGDPVKIGVALPLTGPAATYGEDISRGIDFAVDEVNADGGILGGRMIEVIYEDDKATPEGGVTAVQKLMQEHNVDAITGGALSSVVLAETSITKGKILQVNMGAQADAITEEGGPWVFQINNTTTMNGEAFNAWITESLQPETIAYLGENTAFNAGVLSQLEADMEAAGIEITQTAQYEADTRDFTPILNRVRGDNPDVLYIADGLVDRAAVLLQQASQIGGFDQILISPGVVTESYVDAGGDAIENAITGEIYMPSLDTPENERFVEAYEAKYNSPPFKSQLVAYEGIKIIAEAMDAAGSTDDYDAIAEVMQTSEFESPRGTFRFGELNRGRSETFYIQQVQDGELVLLEEWSVN